MKPRRPTRSKELAARSAVAVTGPPARERSGRSPSTHAPPANAGTVPALPAVPAPFGTLVDDGTTAGPQQMGRTQFLDWVLTAVEDVARAELRKIGRTTDDCPYLGYWLRYYRDKPAARVERAIQRYAQPEATDPAGLATAVVKRAHRAVQLWAATGRVDAPAGVAWMGGGDGLDVPSVSARLGSGTALESGTRVQMEQSFGRSFAAVRVHTGRDATALSQSLSARAFTVGRHIAFGAGEYRPGTLVGDALLAHELAHIVQQSGSAGTAAGAATDPGLEANADQVAALALARAAALPFQASRAVAHERAHAQQPSPPAASRILSALTSVQHFYRASAPASLARPSGGLRLQRCKTGPKEKEEVTAGDKQWSARALEPAMGAGQRSSTVTPEPASILASLGDNWSRLPDDHLLAVQSEDRLFLVPAHFFVSEGKEPMAARATPPDPSRGPVGGLPAVGHGSLSLFNLGGTGILFDAGGAGGNTRTILPQALVALKTSLGITRIDGVLLMHTHADHVRHLVKLIEAGQIQGNRVWIWPGWEQATKGPWAKALEALRDPSMTARGFGPTWSPTPLPVQTIGATGTELTVATLRVGNAELSMVTRSADLAAYVGELTSGSTGTRTADASSMLTRIRVPGAPDVLVVGDLRGRTLQDIETQMAAAGTPLADWVAQVRIVVGFHHLGNVETGTDTAGYSTLLRALPVGQKVTVIAQANPNNVNTEFVNRLTASGTDVIIAPKADPDTLRQVTLSQSQRVIPKGVKVYQATGAAAEANARIALLRAASEVLRSRVISGSLMVSGQASAAQQLGDALEAEAKVLEQAVRDRRTLEMQGLDSKTRPADYATKAADSDAALRAKGSYETQVGADNLNQIARAQPRVGALERLMQEVASTGQSRPELRALIAEVGPDVFREILQRNRVEDASAGVARERAIRASLAQLLNQRELQRALQTGPGTVGMIGRGFLAFTALVELANAIGPYITRARDAANASELQKLMSLVGAIGWWQRLGLNVPFSAEAGGVRLAPEKVGAAIARRIWDATPVQGRVLERDLPPAVKSASPLEKLTVPSAADWPVSFWALFVERLATLMPTWNEWYRWINDDPAVGIRAAYGDLDKDPWQVLTGTVNWGGLSVPLWETEDRLTAAMRARLAVVRTTTTTWLETERPKPLPKTGQRDTTPSVSVPRYPRATFKAGASRTVFGPYGLREVKGVTWTAVTPTFIVLDDPAPKDMTWVTGADEVTYRDIRGMTVYRYDPAAVVQLRRPTRDDRTYGEAAGIEPSWYDWATKHGTDDERTAAELAHQGAPDTEWVEYPAGHMLRGDYYGEVRFPGNRPNTSGMILLKIADLDIP